MDFLYPLRTGKDLCLLPFAIRFAVLGRRKPSCNVSFAIAIGRGHPPLIRHLGNAPSQVRVAKVGTAPKKIFCSCLVVIYFRRSSLRPSSLGTQLASPLQRLEVSNRAWRGGYRRYFAAFYSGTELHSGSLHRGVAKWTRQVALMHGSHLKSFRQSRQCQHKATMFSNASREKERDGTTSPSSGPCRLSSQLLNALCL